MAESDAEKTQSATPRRRQQAIEQGNLWQPRELGPAAAVVIAALAAAIFGARLWQSLGTYLLSSLVDATIPADDGVATTAIFASTPLFWPASLAAAVAVLSVALALATTRHVSLALLAPKFARISPVAGFKRIVSIQGLAGAATAILKLAAFAGVALAVIVPLLPALAHIGEDGATIGAGVTRLLGAAALAMIAIAIIDAGISFVLRERKLMMSLEDVKRESRENNGAPEVKAAIKRAQFAAATRRMRTSLAEAAVVVVNPTHFAVAMRYRPDRDAAPVVVEKGRLEMAHAVISVARELGIPIIRTPRLARALFFTARLGAPVREELFGAVATILAFVMSFDDPEHEAAPAIFVPPEFDFDEAGARRRPGAA